MGDGGFPNVGFESGSVCRWIGVVTGVMGDLLMRVVNRGQFVAGLK